MNKYELMIIYKENLDEKEVKEQIELLKEKIAEFKGKVTNEDYWGLKDFAYEMSKQVQGYYDILTLEIEPSEINKVMEWLRHQQETVLKTMLTKLED